MFLENFRFQKLQKPPASTIVDTVGGVYKVRQVWACNCSRWICVHLNNSERTLNSGGWEGRSDRGPLLLVSREIFNNSNRMACDRQFLPDNHQKVWKKSGVCYSLPALNVFRSFGLLFQRWNTLLGYQSLFWLQSRWNLNSTFLVLRWGRNFPILCICSPRGILGQCPSRYLAQSLRMEYY